MSHDTIPYSTTKMKVFQFKDGMGHSMRIHPVLFRIGSKLIGIPHLGTRYRLYLLKKTLNSLKLPPNARVIDVGCGYGFNTLELAKRGWDVVGIDKDSERLSVAQDLAEIEGRHIDFRKGNLYRLPFEDNQFDLCLFFEVIEHLRDPQRALSEISRVLRPQGMLILSIPRFSINRFTYKHLGHLREGFTDKELRRIKTTSRFRTKKIIPLGRGMVGRLTMLTSFYATRLSVPLAVALTPVLYTLIRIDEMLPKSNKSLVNAIEVLQKLT